MFTGLIRHLGILESRSPRPGGARLRITAPADLLARAEQGASIAVNGACLTSVAVDGRAWEAELSEETLEKTTLGRLPMGAALHLEPALRVGDPLDGHLVSGHVDGIGQVTHFAQVGESWELRVLAPRALARYLAYKGSITINGVSLTVNQIQDSAEGCEASINLIPHTVENTALGALAAGSSVNLEIDLIARYVERMLHADPQQPHSPLSA